MYTGACTWNRESESARARPRDGDGGDLSVAARPRNSKDRRARAHRRTHRSRVLKREGLWSDRDDCGVVHVVVEALKKESCDR